MPLAVVNGQVSYQSSSFTLTTVVGSILETEPESNVFRPTTAHKKILLMKLSRIVVSQHFT